MNCFPIFTHSNFIQLSPGGDQISPGWKHRSMSFGGHHCVTFYFFQWKSKKQMYDTDVDCVSDVWLIYNDTARLYTLPTALTSHQLIRVSLKGEKQHQFIHRFNFIYTASLVSRLFWMICNIVIYYIPLLRCVWLVHYFSSSFNAVYDLNSFLG